VAQQLQFLLTGLTVTQVREGIRNVAIVARSAGSERLDPARLKGFSLISRDGHRVPLDQIGHSEIQLEEPILKRRDRTPVITIRSDVNEATQPPEVSKQIMQALEPLIATLPEGYRIEMGGSIERRQKRIARWQKSFRS
jgi:multidrug efflux pump subunit AcrB